MNRRGFLRGLVSTVVASPFVKLPVLATRKVASVILTWGRPLLNSSAWDARFKTYEEAKEASDKLGEEVIRRMLDAK